MAGVYQVTLVRRALEAALRQLVQSPQAIAYGQAGLSRTANQTEVICQDLSVVQGVPLSLTAPAVVLMLGEGGAQIRQQRLQVLRWWAEGTFAAGPVALLSLERQPRRGHVTASVLSTAGVTQPVHVLKLVGPGMHRVLTAEGQRVCPDPALTGQDQERWSRVIGALGQQTWQRLRSLRYCLVGVGRTGSVVATSLARMGTRHLTLIDPDRVELHNVDAMDGVTVTDIGAYKAMSVCKALLTINSDAAIYALPTSITTLPGLARAKEADVLLCCADHDGARLATAVLATLYAKPLLDIGTGVFGTGTQRQMGADVRLILPGERCLLCLGGIANMEQARMTFTGQSPLPRRAWYRERAGSLRSLNQIATHLGLRLLEDLSSARVQHSTWLHLEFDHQGLPAVQVLTPPLDPTCSLCQNTSAGDAALESVKGVVSALRGRKPPDNL